MEPPLSRQQKNFLKWFKGIKEKRKKEMTNKLYDIAKWTITVGLVGLAVFVQTLGLNFVLWNANGVEVNVVLLLNSIAALGATYLGISSINYRRGE